MNKIFEKKKGISNQNKGILKSYNYLSLADILKISSSWSILVVRLSVIVVGVVGIVCISTFSWDSVSTIFLIVEGSRAVLLATFMMMSWSFLDNIPAVISRSSILIVVGVIFSWFSFSLLELSLFTFCSRLSWLFRFSELLIFMIISLLISLLFTIDISFLSNFLSSSCLSNFLGLLFSLFYLSSLLNCSDLFNLSLRDCLNCWSLLNLWNMSGSFDDNCFSRFFIENDFNNLIRFSNNLCDGDSLMLKESLLDDNLIHEGFLLLKIRINKSSRETDSVSRIIMEHLIVHISKNRVGVSLMGILSSVVKCANLEQ